MPKNRDAEFSLDDNEEFEYDMVRGSHGKKPKMAMLNKRQVSSDTIDQLADELEPNEPENQAGIEETIEDQNG